MYWFHKVNYLLLVNSVQFLVPLMQYIFRHTDMSLDMCKIDTTHC